MPLSASLASPPSASSAMLSPVLLLEMVAVVHALKALLPYLLDEPFELHTDNASLQLLQQQRHVSHNKARWLNLLAEYKYRVVHIQDCTNQMILPTSSPGSASPTARAQRRARATTSRIRRLSSSQCLARPRARPRRARAAAAPLDGEDEDVDAEEEGDAAEGAEVHRGGGGPQRKGGEGGGGAASAFVAAGSAAESHRYLNADFAAELPSDPVLGPLAAAPQVRLPRRAALPQQPARRSHLRTGGGRTSRRCCTSSTLHRWAGTLVATRRLPWRTALCDAPACRQR